MYNIFVCCEQFSAQPLRACYENLNFEFNLINYKILMETTCEKKSFECQQKDNLTYRFVILL